MATFKTSVEKAKQKAAEEAAKAENRFQKTARLFWKPKQGQNRVRILPAWTGEGPNANQFWRELYVHWGVGPDEENQINFACPRLTPGSENKECPICDEYNRLRGTKDPTDLEAAKELRARQRAYSNIIDLTDPVWTQDDVDELKLQGVEELPEVDSPKIQVFNYGPTILKELLDIFCDEIDLTDLQEGHNVVITRTGKDLQTQYRVRIETKASPAPVDAEPSLHDLDEIMPFKEAYIMKAALEGIDPEEMKKLTQGEGGNGESKPAAKPASKPAAAAKPAARKPAPKPEPEPEEAAEEEVVEEEAVEEEAAPEEEAAAEEEAVEEEAAAEEEAVEEEAAAEEDAPPPCFGNELDANDSQCRDDCGLFEDCKAATEARLAKEKRKPVSKPAAKPAAAPAAKPAAKPAAPAAAGKKASPATGKAVTGKMDTGDVDDLAKRMRQAIGDGNR